MQRRPNIGDTIEVGGLKAKIASDEECEASAFVVCGAESHWADDVKTTCSACGTTVFHRPYAPKKPPRICIPCMGKLAGPVGHVTTAKAEAELARKKLLDS